MSQKKYLIEGGKKLQGTVEVQAAKNSISKQLVASLMTDEPCTFNNVPGISEITVLLDMLGEIGMQYEWLDKNTLQVQTPSISQTVVSQKYSGFNRIPILMLGPLLHRSGEVTVPVVGGCEIGPRPVDFHLNALKAIGAEITFDKDGYKACGSRLKGTTIHLPYPSVGATENAVITACLCKGTTVISNAAVEPEIIDTILFLQKMGALIQVDVDRRIIIEGVERLHGTIHQTTPDRIEAASFAAAAIATNGRIMVRNANQRDMITFLNNFRKIGGGFHITHEGIEFFRARTHLNPVHIETDVHPGFMTDWQQPFVVALTQAQGVSVVHETVYENRFGYTRTLGEMGADIDLTWACLGGRNCRFKDQDHLHSCIVRGTTPLKARKITIPDLRAGFAYLIAALLASGISEVTGIHYIERGYAQAPEKLEAVGASIQVIEDAPEKIHP